MLANINWQSLYQKCFVCATYRFLGHCYRPPPGDHTRRICFSRMAEDEAQQASDTDLTVTNSPTIRLHIIMNDCHVSIRRASVSPVTSAKIHLLSLARRLVAAWEGTCLLGAPRSIQSRVFFLHGYTARLALTSPFTSSLLTTFNISQERRY